LSGQIKQQSQTKGKTKKQNKKETRKRKLKKLRESTGGQGGLIYQQR
jgi:hypothetical protein